MKRIFAILLALCAMLGAIAIPVGAAEISVESFLDLDPARYYYDGVKYCVDQRLMTGTAVGEFRPEGELTRAMFLTVLHRMDGAENAEQEIPFTDIPVSCYYRDAVKWAVANGIVNGTTPTTFSPDAPITREMMCVLMVRYARYRGYSLPVGAPDMTPEWFMVEYKMASYEMNDSLMAPPFAFADTPSISDYALDAVYVCYNAEVITGVSEEEFRPRGTATRGQMATILTRFLHKIAYTVSEKISETETVYTLTDQMGVEFAAQVDTLDESGRVIRSVYTEGDYVKTQEMEYDGRWMVRHAYSDTDGVQQTMTFDPESKVTTVKIEEVTLTYTVGDYGNENAVLSVELSEDGIRYFGNVHYEYTYRDGRLEQVLLTTIIELQSGGMSSKTTTKEKVTYRYNEQGVMTGLVTGPAADNTQGFTYELTFDPERTVYTLTVYLGEEELSVMAYDKNAGTLTVIDGQTSEVIPLEDWFA